MGLDFLIPLIVFTICLLPNLVMIWAAKKLKVSLKLGNWSHVLATFSLLAYYISYLLIRDDLAIFSLLVAIAGAITALITIDYFLTRQRLITKILGSLVYFIVLVLCETVIIGITGHM